MRTPRLAILALAALAIALPIAARVHAGGSQEARTSSTATSSLPAVGQMAPDFTLPATTGKDVTLSKLRGKTVVLYFYPKDETPGCTKEACDFRDHDAALHKAGIVLLGVSNDDLKSHAHFREKEHLPFPLLADVDAKVSKLYGVYGTNQYGDRTWTGISRTTFVIGKDGHIEKVWPKVNVDGHVEDVLKFVSSGATSERVLSPDDPTPVVHSDAEWRALLTPEQYHILRASGTELACSGKYWREHRAGVYRCAACGYNLFESRTKFESGTGWPSFFAPIAAARLTIVKDTSYGMVREEVRCARCGSHLGHVFDDGPAPTGQRYCMNSVALQFVPTPEPAPHAHAPNGNQTAADNRTNI